MFEKWVKVKVKVYWYVVNFRDEGLMYATWRISTSTGENKLI
jgi:hypothetical protein